MDKQLSPRQQSVINALLAGQRLCCVEHTATGLFAGKLYNATLSSLQKYVHTSTLKSLVRKGYLKERKREVWHKADDGQWTLYQIEYEGNHASL